MREEQFKVKIRRFEEEDIPLKVQWINDPLNNKYLHYQLPLEIEKTKQWFKRISADKNRFDGIILVNEEPAGLIGLLNIDLINLKAEFYIALCNDKFVGKGIAKFASKKLIRFAFEDLYLNKIYLFTETDNESAIKLFESIGFKQEGILKQDIMNKGTLKDRIFMGLFKDE